MDVLKRRYFIWHLISSLSVISFISFICLTFWFPEPFLSIDGTWIALLILATVDIILGPLLTLLLVTTKKSPRERLLDMLVIVVLQITALVYGLVQIEQERVWAIIHLDGVFNLVTKKEINYKDLSAQLNLPQYKGVYYAMVLNSDLPSHSILTNKPLLYSPKMFLPITKQQMATGFNYKNLPQYIKDKYNKEYIFKTLVGKKRNGVLIINSNMHLVDILLLPQLNHKNKVD